MKYILIILLFFFPTAYGEESIDFTYASGDIFKLSIETSFHGKTKFTLSMHEGKYDMTVESSTVEYFGKDRDDEKEIKVTRFVGLDNKLAKKYIKKFERALGYNTLDDESGFDGSTWCLDSRRGSTRTFACFWAPSNKTQERGLSGLYELGKFLWTEFDIDKNKKKKLY